MTDYRRFFELHLKGIKWRTGGEGAAKCPFHEDRKASLSVNRESGLWFCHACNVGGTAHEFAERLRVEAPASNRKSAEHVFNYRDERGELLYQVVRFAGKKFSQRRPDGKGGWLWNLEGVRRVPYRLPELLASKGNVFIVEGEKDVETIRAQGLTATCNSGGAGKWHDEYGEHLRDRVCILIADNDEPGRAHMRDLAQMLNPFTTQVIRVELPGLPEKGDVSDWFAQGHTAAELFALVDETKKSGAARDSGEGAHPATLDEWPEPERIGGELVSVPELALDIVPAPLRAWLSDVAERFQCPIDYLAPPMVIAAGMIIGRKVSIRPKECDDWREFANLWGVVVGPSGMMKSPALHEALRPLRRIETEAREKYRCEMQEQAYRKSIATITRQHIEDEMKKRVKSGKSTDDLREELRRAEFAETVERRYIVGDSTPQKLGALLIENPNGLLLVRDELSSLLWRLEDEDFQSERGFYLECWSGKEALRTDRIGRGSSFGEAACLSIVGGVTPRTLDQFVRSVYSGLRDDGMLQRFQVTAYPDPPGAFRNVDREPAREARDRVYQLFSKLDRMTAADFHAHADGDNDFFLRFEPHAQGVFNDWRDRLETRLRDRSEHPVFVSHLSKFRKLLPALALIFQAIAVADGAAPGPVTVEALRQAIAWTEYLEAHARRIYQGAIQPQETAAAVLVERIKLPHFPEVFTVRDVQRKGWSGLNQKEIVVAAIEMAEEAGYVRREPSQHSGPGRPKERWRVNPRVRG